MTILERLKALTGPDRKVDAAIARMFDLPRCTEPDCLPDVMIRIINRVETGGDYDPEIAAYTASLDATIALVAKLYPTAVCSLDIYPEKTRAQIGLNRAELDIMGGGDATAPTPAIALLIALFEAKEGEKP